MKKAKWRDYRSMVAPVATMVLGFSVALFLAALAGLGLDLDAAARPRDLGGPSALALSGTLTAIIGLLLYLYGRRHRSTSMTRREATLAVALVWVVACLTGALPFVLGFQMSLVDAIFESTSGLTTTGSTVLDGLETLPRSLLLWRSVLQWLGGMGIVVLFVAVFPSFGVGGKHMMRGEVPGTSSQGLKPRIRETAFVLWLIYLVFTVLVAATYWFLGMSPFDAVNHAFTTVSTGGFSTHGESIGWFQSPSISCVCSVFMLAASINYGLYFLAFRKHSLRVVLNDTEVRVFALVSGLAILTLFGALFAFYDKNLAQAFEAALFATATTISSTGYGLDDPSLFPAPATMIVVLLMFLGGCSGSTAGGIKVDRVVLVVKHAGRQLERFVRPRVVRSLRMGNKPIDEALLDGVAAFLTIFVGCFAFGTLALTWTEGFSAPSAAGATLTCLSNMGPALFHPDGPDTFSHYSWAGKLLSALFMLLGRLEFFTILALFSAEQWKR